MMTTLKYIVTADNPHYPRVVYADSLREAEQIARDVREELDAEDGHNKFKIVIAKVEQSTDCRSYY